MTETQHTTLKVTGPSWYKSFTAEEGGHKYTVTRLGTQVPESGADSLIKRAKAHGVTLQRVKASATGSDGKSE